MSSGSLFQIFGPVLLDFYIIRAYSGIYFFDVKYFPWKLGLNY